MPYARQRPRPRQLRTFNDMKKALTAIQAETAALAISVIWLLVVQFAAVLAWDAEILTRQSALVHWLVVGVLPPALALWGMKNPESETE
jgi:hypothetical protein